MYNLLNSISLDAIIDIIISGLVFIFLLIMTLRTLLAPKAKTGEQTVHYDLDLSRAVKNLSKAIQIPTISPKFKGDNKEAFLAYEKFLEESYPLIHTTAKKTVINDHALIFHIKGSDDSLLPIAFLAHQDVVPSTEDSWDYPPFSGKIVNIDGEEFIYGRGTVDMKGQMISTLEAVEYCLKNNIKLKRDLYLCFGYDEELTGTLGALSIVKHLQKNNVVFEFIIDEGGLVLDGKMLGIKGNVALIGNSEKGYIDYALSATCDGGHSSAPMHPTSIETLSKAITKLSKKPLPLRWTKSTEELFNALIPHMNFLARFVCVNRNIFSPILKAVLAKVNPAVEAVMRTTIAPTMIKGSDALNTISKTATVNINCRLLEGDTDQSVKEHIKKAVGKHIKVEMEKTSSYDPPSPFSSIDTPSYQLIAKSIAQSFGNLIPAPFTFIAGSDAKFYYPVSKHIYRFTPFMVDIDDAEMIHGANERLKTKELIPAITFFIRVIENANK
ncbi:MAG: M20/M25/M40 family metallo-hydrolase [Clostridiales bacterium]|nr:M20/M25/M40 family metallo-hydrolase [Clostridiales bacterium]